MPAQPRRTCPACAKRYAGLVATDCPICQGLGVLTLGAAALHNYDTAAVARAIDLYLEHNAQAIRDQLPLGSRRAALEAATDNLRAAGILARNTDGPGRPAKAAAPRDAASTRVTELEAYRVTRDLGARPTTAVLNALAAPPLPPTDLHTARPRTGTIPTASTTGHRSATATIADPIDPLGPDTTTILNTRVTADYRAKVIAHAVPTAANRRRRKETPTP